MPFIAKTPPRRLLLSAVACLTLLTLCLFAVWARRGRTFGQARQALSEGEAERALELLDRCQVNENQRAELAYLRAVGQRESGQLAEAAASLRLAKRLGWDRRQIEQQQHLLAFQAGDVARAGPFLLAWLAEGADDEQAGQIYDCLVKGYLTAVRLDEAAYTLDLWLRWRPRAIRPRFMQADLFRATREREREMEAYREILRIDPGQMAAHRELGRTLLENNAVAAASEHLELYRAQHPDDVRALTALAACRRKQGFPEEARTLLKQALRSDVDPRQRADALTELAQIQLEENSAGQSIETLRRAIELAPSNSAAHYTLALALSRVDRRSEAGAEFAESERIADQDATLADLAQQIIAHPKDAALRCQAVEILLDQGQTAEARLWLISALHCDERHTASSHALAEYRRRTGEDLRYNPALASPPSLEPSAPHTP